MEIKNALAMVARASELYLASLDDLARTFTQPQLQEALTLLEKATAVAPPEE